MTDPTLTVFAVLLLIAVLADPLARRIHLPFSALLVILGFAGGQLVTGLGVKTGLRWEHFADLILHGFLPLLVFEAAFNMNARLLLRNLAPILMLAVPGVAAAAGITAVLLYYGIGHPGGFPWAAALLAGVIVSATDPVAVIALFKRLGAPERLTVLLEGESLFNDAATIVLYTVLIGWLSHPAAPPTPGGVVTEFLIVFCGGVLTGLACGAALWSVYRLYRQTVSRAALSLTLPVGTFFLAEQVGVSGIVAVLSARLLLGEVHRREGGDRFVNRLWQMNAYIANGLIFLLTGVTVTLAMFADRWLAILIGIGAALCARAVILFGLLPLTACLPKVPAVDNRDKNLMLWGGLRGAVTLALALSLPTQAQGWYTIQSVAYGVALFTLFVQAPIMSPLIHRALPR